MTIHILIDKLENEFDEIQKGSLQPESILREVINWSSINSVVVTTMIEYEFDVLVLPEEMNDIVTISELFQLISEKNI